MSSSGLVSVDLVERYSGTPEIPRQQPQKPLDDVHNSLMDDLNASLKNIIAGSVDIDLAETELGAACLAYLKWKLDEDGASPQTIRGYFYTLERLAGTHPDIGVQQLTIDHLRWCRDLWPEKSKYKVTAVFKDFCRWLYEENFTAENVAGRMRYPKKQRAPITDLFTD